MKSLLGNAEYLKMSDFFQKVNLPKLGCDYVKVERTGEGAIKVSLFI